jgi:hypothetical protein
MPDTPALDAPGVLEALREMYAVCHRLEQQPGMGHYRPVSVRSLHAELAIEAELELVLAACVEGGFEYCLDRTIPAKTYPDFELRYPPQDACSWGPDQLRSRLECISFRVRKEL